MAAHYRNGGLPPWAPPQGGFGDGSVKSPLVSPTQGVYSNLPANPYSNPTGVTGYTAVNYHPGNSVPPTPVPQSLSPQPRHSQYSSASFEPYAPPNLHHSIMYAPSPGTPAQFSPPPSATYGATNPYGAPVPQGTPAPSGTPAPPGTPGHYATTYDSPPREPGNTEAGGSVQAPAYSGGPYAANEYHQEKK